MTKKQTEPLDGATKANVHKVRTAYNRISSGSTGQRFTQLSLTVPGQSMSIQQMLERQRQGLPITVHSYTGLYDEEGIHTNGISLQTLDLEELRELREANKIDIAEYQRIIREENERIRLEAEKSKEAEWLQFLEKNRKEKQEEVKPPLSTNTP